MLAITSFNLHRPTLGGWSSSWMKASTSAVGDASCPIRLYARISCRSGL